MFPNLHPRKYQSGVLLHLAKLAFFFLNLELGSNVMPRFARQGIINTGPNKNLSTNAHGGSAYGSQKMGTPQMSTR